MTTTSWALVLSALVAVGCTNGNGPTLARPNTTRIQSNQHQALGATNLQSSAQFDAPVIDATSSGPMSTGTGSFSVAPSLSGGNDSVGVIDASFQYVMVGDLTGSPAQFFAILADVPFTTGAHAIDNVHWFAGVFDAASGEPTHLATTGTVTFTTTGGLGGRWVGSFTGSLDEVSSVPSCRSSADCAAGEVCSNGACVAPPQPQCTSNSQCGAGQQCQAGICVPVSQPQCTTNAQCGAGQQCQNGVCTFACAVDADCSRGEVCVAGQCTAPQPQCTSNTQCPLGWVCASGACTPGSAQCGAQQGDGALSGQVTTVASCAALPASQVSITQAIAAIDDELRLVIFDASSGDEGAVLELAVCPGATGTLSLGNGLISAAHVKDVQTPTLRLFAERRASAATLTLTQVAPSLAGSFSLTIATGGSVSGSFTMH